MRFPTSQRSRHATYGPLQTRTGRGLSPSVRKAILLLAVASWIAVNPGLGTAEELTALSPPSAHAAFAEQLAAESRARKAEAVRWAVENRVPVRWDNGQQICELMALWDSRPVYYVTANRNAAISLQTDRVRDLLPWDLDGEGILVGVWDAAGVRETHQEFQGPDGQSRVTILAGSATSAHSTHVAGTIGATGVVPSAKGMAPGVRIESYNWNDDLSQMSGRAAGRPGETNAIYVSNHSYGIMVGWEYLASDSYSGHIGWHWWGEWTGPDSIEPWFGSYSDIASGWDQVTWRSPYYLAFTSAGNDRNDGPEVGETVYYRAGGGWHDIVYSPDTCPPGDGQAKGGYDTISFFAVAKNVMTVGAVHDAVSQGTHSTSHAVMSDFSCWGPTDDGRIKPDIVANGVGVYSAVDYADDAYMMADGTSMASPAAAGSAALLIQHYGRLFPGQSMRASTLKGLILHTADDLGRPGPDYEFGWGLMNTKDAAELITKQHDDVRGDTILESRFDADSAYHTYYLYAESDDPIRVTLCWTDPDTIHGLFDDWPAHYVVHDLDLRVTGPSGATVYYPYVLDRNNPAAPAQTGNNSRDNVEQVCLLTPGERGLYEVRVYSPERWQSEEQYYSLISSHPLFRERPPKSKRQTTLVPASEPTSITLHAEDDGLPNPPGTLMYAIASLPEHGVLETVDGDVIVEPTVLADHADQVVYRADAGFTGDDRFTFYADDGGTHPSGGLSDVATVTLTVRDIGMGHYQISAPGDDAYGGEDHQFASAQTLWVGQDRTGMRFTNVAIPQGSTIISAHLELHPEYVRNVNGAVWAEAAGDTLDFTGDHPTVWQRPRTSVAVLWDWSGAEPALTWYTSPDIKEVIQEVIDRPDWSEGHALTILYGGQEIGGQSMFFSAWEKSSDLAPKLEILYSASSGAGPQSPSSPPGQTPPTVQDMDLFASWNRSQMISLTGQDDGLPMALSYTIASLPEHGTLSTDGVEIPEPMTLEDSVDHVVYMPETGFTGDDSFTLYADDGGTAPLGGTSNVATVTIRVRNVVSRQYEVVAGADDASGAAGDPLVFSETLTVGKYGSAMRFRNIDIPPGSEIVSARLLICMATDSIEQPVEGVLQAEAVADAADFAGGDRHIFELPTTGASVPWTWQAFDVCPRETYCPSPDISLVIQEVVDRPDWSQGNALAILYLPTADHGQDLAFYACDDAYSDRAAKLEVTFAPNLDAEPMEPPVRQTPPTVEQIEASTESDTAVTITLTATDDGLPDPPGRLAYAIASMPSHGALEYPGGVSIIEPTTLIDFGDTVVYRPDAGFSGPDRFTFYADDGGMVPDGGASSIATVTISVGGDYAHLPQPQHHWAFDEGEGNTAYDLVGGQHGAVHGAKWVAGQVGGALSFSGYGDHVRLPDNAPIWLPQEDFTLAVWAYFETDSGSAIGTFEQILDLNFADSAYPTRELGYGLVKRSSTNQVIFQMTTTTVADEDLASNTSFSKREWYHIVAVRKADRQSIYINGQLDATGPCSSTPIDFVGMYNNGEVNFGRLTRNGTSPTGHFKGVLDEIMIYDTALTPPEIAQIYEAGAGPQP